MYPLVYCSTSISVPDLNLNTILSSNTLKYEYDKNGNLVKEFDIIQNGKACSDKEKFKTQNTYNALNQLVSSGTSEFTVTNEYNAEGLRTGKEVKSEGIDTTTKTNYTYEYDKVIFETDSSDNYIWNVQGINLISRQINGEMFYCMYNAHADITRMVDENGELAEKYYYDEWGVETETLRYGDITGDGEVNINDYSLMKRLILLNKSELTVEQKIVSDINADGKVDKDDVNILKQILFGDLKYCQADTNKDGFINEKNNIKYAGYFYDAETVLYYLNARFYDPETARFIQQDSYSGNILDPLSLNLYTYAQNNPISYYDPTGHSIKSLLKKAKDTVNKVVNTVKVAATIAKPVVKQAVKVAAAVTVNTKAMTVNTTVRKVTTPIANTINAVANKTENQRAAFQTVLTIGKSFQSPVVNAWANYSQGEYDTLAGQINGFMQFNDNPVQTVGDSINYFLSDPLRNNPVYGVYQYGKGFKKAVAENDWNTASYKLGVGAINTVEVAASVAIGGKIGGKIPTGKVAVPKVNALSKIGNAIDNFGAPQLAGANGIVISGAVPAEVSVSSSVSAGALGVRAGVAAGGVVYASKNSGQSSCGGGSLNDANDSATVSQNVKRDGADRAAEFSKNWKRANLSDAIDKFAPNSNPTTTASGKTVYKNSETGIQIVYDSKGNYFRIEDTNKVGKRKYLDLNGKDVSNKIENGKQKGRSGPEYEAITHFYNIK